MTECQRAVPYGPRKVPLLPRHRRQPTRPRSRSRYGLWPARRATREPSRALRSRRVFEPIAGVPTHCSAISASVRGIGASDGRLANRERRKGPVRPVARDVDRQQGRQRGAPDRDSSFSPSVDSSMNTGSARPSWSSTERTGSQLSSPTPKSRRAVAMTDTPGTLAASRTRSITVSRSSLP